MDDSLRDGVDNRRADDIVAALRRAQYVRPHDSVFAALAAISSELGICPDAAGQATAAVQIDQQQVIGRLRSSEIFQLGRTIYRLWTQDRTSGRASPAGLIH